MGFAPVLLLAWAAAAVATPFVLDDIDAYTGSSSGPYADLALDARDNPHVSFWAYSTALGYATKRDGRWCFERIDEGPYVGSHTSLALDTRGNPHISYRDDDLDILKYATKAGGVWTIETVDASTDAGLHSSVAIDPQGRPHICYFDLTNGDLKYAIRSSGVWGLQTVDSTGDVGRYCSLAIDAVGRSHVSYYDLTNSSLRYGVREGGSWSLETVNTPGSGGQLTCLALGPEGRPHIAYEEGPGYLVKYATKIQGDWSIETVATTTLYGDPHISLDVDAHGTPHLSFRGDPGGYLAYAVKVSGGWAAETVDPVVGCNYTSLALDSQGNPVILYPGGNPGPALADSGIRLTSPRGGETWVGGSRETVTWTGAGEVDIQLSWDGGGGYTTLLFGVGGGRAEVAVPLWESEEARVRIWRASPFSTSESAGLIRTVLPWDPPAAAHRVSLTLAGGTTGDMFGYDVASIGDFDADGHPDLAVGASGFAAAGGNPGAVLIYHGGLDLDEASDRIWTGEADGDSFGEPVRSAGDVDGDGYPDVLVGAHRNDAGADDGGRAYVYFGGPTADDVADLTFTGDQDASAFGDYLDSAGDVNGDGYDDVIVGAYRQTGALMWSGQAYVYYGGPSADAEADLVVTGVQSREFLGAGVAGAGDVDGDGYDDFLVSSSQYDGPATDSGRVQLFYGGASPDTVADLVFEGRFPYEYFGLPVAGVGDLNGDGYADFAIGANGDFTRGEGAGAAYVFFGGPGLDPDEPDLVLYGEQAGDYFPWSLDGGTDVNGDGHPDLVAGNGNSDFGGSDAGRAYVWYGGPGCDAVRDVVLTGGVPGGRFGSGVALVPDLYGDEMGDVLVGEYANGSGRAYLYDGRRYHLLAPESGETWNVGAAAEVRWLGAELADLWLSVDGGATYGLLRSGAGGGAANVMQLLVPHQPTRFARLRLTPADATLTGWGESDSLFTIDASILLLTLKAEPAPTGGALISWQSAPGPSDLRGYRLEKALPGDAGAVDWRPLVELTRQTSHLDPGAAPGDRYRLSGVNGLGEEYRLGETSFGIAARLAAWPLPYRSGDLQISFATVGGAGGGAGPAAVRIYDVRGRCLRTVVEKSYPAGFHLTTWDGRDDAGRTVPSGVYFLRSSSGGHAETGKVVVVR